ncbi:MAG: PfkB family carbohydrate kinase [Balneolaceae bacterium]
MSLLIVGSVAYDGIETPFGKIERILGGSATYLSLTSSYFSDQINLVGVVGKDFAQSDIELLKSRNIDLEGLQVDRSGNTFFWKGKYHFDLNNRDTLDTQLNVFEKFDPVIPDSYKDSQYIALGNIEPSLQEKVLDQVNNPKLVVLDTMNFWIEGTPDALKNTLKRVDMLVVNDSEARELTGEPNLFKAAKMIRNLGPKYLIIKKGEHGALLFTGEEIFTAPAFPVIDIFDPTGAGDTFMGGLLGWLDYTDDLSPENMRRAVVFGSVMASFCVEEFGPDRLKNLSEDQIYSRYSEFKQLSHIPAITDLTPEH